MVENSSQKDIDCSTPCRLWLQNMSTTTQHRVSSTAPVSRPGYDDILHPVEIPLIGKLDFDKRGTTF